MSQDLLNQIAAGRDAVSKIQTNKSFIFNLSFFLMSIIERLVNLGVKQ